MSMYLPFTKQEASTEMLQAPGSSFQAEGQAVVRVNTNTSQGVMPSTGAASDVFCGFAIAGTSALPSTGVITLSVTPDSAADVGALDLTTGQFYSTTTTPAITVTGAQVSGLTAGDQVQVTYQYDLTTVQRRALFGDIQPGGYVGDTIGQIGVITRGTVYTSEFDHSANWQLAGSTAALQLVAGANGQVKLGTVGTNGAAIPGYVVSLPTQDVPFLGITFSAP
jgi:hypothetical protein